MTAQSPAANGGGAALAIAAEVPSIGAMVVSAAADAWSIFRNHNQILLNPLSMLRNMGLAVEAAFGHTDLGRFVTRYRGCILVAVSVVSLITGVGLAYQILEATGWLAEAGVTLFGQAYYGLSILTSLGECNASIGSPSFYY